MTCGNEVSSVTVTIGTPVSCTIRDGGTCNPVTSALSLSNLAGSTATVAVSGAQLTFTGVNPGSGTLWINAAGYPQLQLPVTVVAPSPMVATIP